MKGVVKLLTFPGAAIRGKGAKRRTFSRLSLLTVAQHQHGRRDRQQEGMLLAGRPMGMAGLNARAEETDQSVFRPSIGKEPLPVALLLAAEVPATQDILQQGAA